MASAELDVVLDHLKSLTNIQMTGRRASIRALRRMTELYAMADPSCARLQTTVTPTMVGAIPAEWHTGPDLDPQRRLLYIHGGGWMAGSLGSHRAQVSHLAAATGWTTLAIDYRLAPEHPFPSGLDDCLEAYRWLRSHSPTRPAPTRTVAIAGDSAGGNLALACGLALRDRGEPLPTSIVAFSPVTDFSGTTPSRSSRRDVDPIIPADGIDKTGLAYTGGTVPLDHPWVAPLHAELAGFPPVLLQVGDAEVLLSDSQLFFDKARAAGVDVVLSVFPEMPHVFQAFAGFLAVADAALDRVRAFLTRTAE